MQKVYNNTIIVTSNKGCRTLAVVHDDRGSAWSRSVSFDQKTVPKTDNTVGGWGKPLKRVTFAHSRLEN